MVDKEAVLRGENGKYELEDVPEVGAAGGNVVQLLLDGSTHVWQHQLGVDGVVAVH